MGKQFDQIDFVKESTFKENLPKLYKLVVSEALSNGINLRDYKFVSAESRSTHWRSY